jgi:hypothetical protein
MVMDTTDRDRLSPAKKRLTEIERRIGPFMPKPVVKSGVKHGEWHSGYNPPPSEQSPRRGSSTKATK